ncbi:MAG TPA: NUDIX domain-containing protein [Gaiellaceae bacterium]|nr:NUDIX domain-containing protein [Gaiellaceae bacterium]
MECTVHKLVADVAVFAGDQVLLVRYQDTSDYDGQRGWFLPDDYLQHLEHPEAAAARILREQAGLDDPPNVRLSHIESFDGGTWHLVFHYAADVAEAAPVAAAGNVLAAEWFGLDSLPQKEDVAHHGWAIDVLAAIER